MKSINSPTLPCSSCGTLNVEHRYACVRCDQPLRAVYKAPQQNKTLLGQTALNINERGHGRQKIIVPNVMMEGERIFRHRVATRDITASGVLVVTNLRCPVGARVLLELPIEGGTYAIEGTIRRVRLDQGQGVYSVGIQFTNDEAALLPRLAA